MNVNLGFSAGTLTITLLALLGIVILKWFMPQLQQLGAMGKPVDPNQDADQWQTPFYLRYNTPIPSYLANLMPVPSNYAYALGVPSAPLTQKTVIS